MAADPGGTKKWAGRAGVLLLLAAVGAALWRECLVRVPRGESLVVQRFGAPVRTLGSGLHLKWPRPVETGRRVSTSQVRFMPIGFKAVDQYVGRRPSAEESQWLTGDTNLVQLAAMVEFQVRDPVRFLFGAEAGADGPAGFLVRKLAEAELSQRVARRGVDELLGGGGQALQTELEQALQESFDRADSGLDLVSVQILRLSAPEDLVADFEAVASARAAAEEAANKADGKARVLLEEARAEAHRLRREAENFRQARVAEARGRAEAFGELLASVRRHPEVSRRRLWMDAVRSALRRVEVLPLPASSEEAPRVIRVRDRR